MRSLIARVIKKAIPVIIAAASVVIRIVATHQPQEESPQSYSVASQVALWILDLGDIVSEVGRLISNAHRGIAPAG